MKLIEFANRLNELVDDGYGEAEMFAVHGASGATDPVGHAFVRDEVDEEMGPFDLKDGEKWIQIYVGN